MDDFDIIRYEMEVVQQARIGLLAAQLLLALHADPRSEIQENDSGTRQLRSDAVHLYRSAFLIAAANVSKLLWPPGGRSSMPHRGPILRAIFDVTADSPLRERRVRNWLEHKDMELERSIERGPLRGSVPGWDTSVGIMVSGPVGSPYRFALYIGGERFEGNPLRDALQAIVDDYRGPVGSRIYERRPDLIPGKRNAE